MQCKRKYQWVKLPRCCLPQGKGVLGTLKRLQEMGYLRYTLDPGTKKLEYRLTDWVAACT